MSFLLCCFKLGVNRPATVSFHGYGVIRGVAAEHKGLEYLASGSHRKFFQAHLALKGACQLACSMTSE